MERAEDPEKIIDHYMRSLNSELGKVKVDAASLLSHERRAKALLNDCSAEIKKLQRYAEKAAESGNEENALTFLERKAKLTEKLSEYQTAYDRASSNAFRMKQIQDKLVTDIGQLETRHAELKAKMSAAKVQQELNAGSSSLGDVHTAFKVMEEEADRALNEAIALAELRAGAREDDLDELIAQLVKDSSTQKE